jgi:uncharacterized membrane protein YGL010W
MPTLYASSPNGGKGTGAAKTFTGTYPKTPITPGTFSITAASVLAVALLAYYFRLDAVLAVAMTLFTAVLLIAANRVCTLGVPVALTVFGVAFVGGWILQLIGHAFEGRKPALVDNFFQVLIAPIFLMAEIFFALGYKREVAERVERLALESEHGS